MLRVKKYMNLLGVAVLALAFSACGGGDSNGTGTVDVGITDAPVDGAQAVVIHFTEAVLHGPNGNTTLPMEDDTNTGNGNNEGRSIDLLQLQGGQWTGLFNDVVTSGHYSWIRLTMDMSKSYIQVNDQQFPLRCTSCENSGFRLNRSFDLATDGVMTLMLDFDLRKSITDPGNGEEYHLRPTVRVVEAETSGGISGTVDANLIAELIGNSENTVCSVYAFAGNDAQLDDIYIPMNMQMPSGQNNPVSTANIEFNDVSYDYTLSFIPAGNFTVAVTCDSENDSADSDDQIVFSQSKNTSVVAGETSSVDFMLPIAE